MGYRPWAIDWYRELWPWMTLNCPRSRSQDFSIKYQISQIRWKTDNGGQVENYLWTCDWQWTWPWMTLNCPSSNSLKFHIKYVENGDRYDDGVNWNRIGNQSWATDLHRDLWPWMTLKRPRSKLLTLHYIISRVMPYVATCCLVLWYMERIVILKISKFKKCIIAAVAIYFKNRKIAIFQ